MPGMIKKCVVLWTILAGMALAQSEHAYDSKEGGGKGLLDPSRFTIHQAATFGMSTSSTGSGLQSQSMYMTMMQYQFSRPVTLNLNFGLPIHSTYNDAQNLTADNLRSADYLKNMPLNASLTWQATDNLQMRLTVAREPYGTGLFYDPYDEPMLRYGGRGSFDRTK